jgi:hypothetical protein
MLLEDVQVVPPCEAGEAGGKYQIAILGSSSRLWLTSFYYFSQVIANEREGCY